MIPVLIVFAALSGSSWSYSTCGDRTPIGRIVDLKIVGDQPVEVRRAGEAMWIRADEGLTICSADQIRSRFRSRARVTIGAEAAGGPIDLVIGVNGRIRTSGQWGSAAADASDPPVVEIIHGVARISVPAGSSYYLRTGPTTCALGGGEALSNWDPFKREANYVVLSGSVSCAIDDSAVSVNPGHRLEIIGGAPMPLKATTPLMLDVFTSATAFD